MNVRTAVLCVPSVTVSTWGEVRSYRKGIAGCGDHSMMGMYSDSALQKFSSCE